MADFGYDISDYTDVDRFFGPWRNSTACSGKSRAPGMRVIVEWVPTTLRSAPVSFARVGERTEQRQARLVRMAHPEPDGGPPNHNGVFNSPRRFGWMFHGGGTGQYYLALVPRRSRPTSMGPTPRWRRRCKKASRFWLKTQASTASRIGTPSNRIAKDPELRGNEPDSASQDWPTIHQPAQDSAQSSTRRERASWARLGWILRGSWNDINHRGRTALAHN